MCIVQTLDKGKRQIREQGRRRRVSKGKEDRKTGEERGSEKERVSK